MCPTLRSCISELSEYFLMGPVPLQRTMYKLSNKPNTTENGDLARKLQSIQNPKFSKNRFHTPTKVLCSYTDHISLGPVLSPRYRERAHVPYGHFHGVQRVGNSISHLRRREVDIWGWVQVEIPMPSAQPNPVGLHLVITCN